MEDQENQEFSWTSLFFVTGICFLVFSFVLKILDAAHVVLFNRIGIGSTSLGIIAYLNTLFATKLLKDNSAQQQME